MNRSQRKWVYAVLAALCVLAAGCRGKEAAAARPLSFDDHVRYAIWGRLQTVEDPPLVCAAGEPILAAAAVRDFFRARDFRPAWSEAGFRKPAADELISAIRDAGRDGLSPDDYHLAALSRLGDGCEVVWMAEADLLLTDAFLLFASHLADGKVDQDARKARWDGRSAKADLASVLERVSAGGDLRSELMNLLPGHEYYAALRRDLTRYEEPAGRGWPGISEGPDLKPGDADSRVPILRGRLWAEGLGPAGPRPEAADRFDEPLGDALCSFQQRHSLPQTGRLDPATRTALNVPASARARQIALNLERWRWLPADLGPRYVMVDVADFELFVVDAAREVMRMKIVAGTQVWPTPCFTSLMTDVVVNPSWNAPSRVLARELVSYIRADANYLKSNGMYLFRGQGREEMLVDPGSIDLAAVTERNLDFRLVQMPGPLNVLGRLKFTHPNRYDIYLHDTPYRSDFGQAVRTFSHGCVRVERPLEFAAYLLGGEPRWTPERVQEQIDKNEERMLLTAGRIAVHVFSGTAWPLADGSIHFRPDIYAADGWLAAALAEKPPAAPVRGRADFVEERAAKPPVRAGKLDLGPKGR
jgi:murein L,D-transpeptidase YcbB/YkuD